MDKEEIKMKEKIKDVIACVGFIILAIGASSADSESLLIPFVITLTGASILYFAAKDYEYEYEEDEEDDY